jgi:hypothetical protein
MLPIASLNIFLQVGDERDPIYFLNPSTYLRPFLMISGSFSLSRVLPSSRFKESIQLHDITSSPPRGDSNSVCCFCLTRFLRGGYGKQKLKPKKEHSFLVTVKQSCLRAGDQWTEAD